MPDADAHDAAGVGVEDFEFDTGGVADDFTAAGDMARDRRDEAAESVDFLVFFVFREDVAVFGLESLDRVARIGDG